MAERYQMVACIGLRTDNKEEMVTVPLYIKVFEQNGRLLPTEQETLIHRVSECMLQRYEQQLAEFIQKKKQGERQEVSLPRTEDSESTKRRKL